MVSLLSRTRLSVSVAAAATVAALSTAALAQMPSDWVPPQLQGVGVEEKLDQTLPLDLTFTNEAGREVKLGDYLNQGRPILLTPIYYECPQLCSLTLNGLVDAMNELKWSAGREFEIVTFSFDPQERARLAEVKKRAYLTQYKRDSAADGWHFLTGDEQNVTALCEAIGFKFKLQPDGEYAHTACVVFITPDGRISRYMNDVMFQPRDLRLALLEAGEGEIGSPMEHLLLLLCYQYDPLSNSYAASAKKLMKLGGAVTMLAMGVGFCVLLVRSGRLRPGRGDDEADAADDANADAPAAMNDAAAGGDRGAP